MRPIDADAVLKKRFNMYMGFCGTVPVVAVEDIDTAPTIDAVPVVRCAECIHRHYVDMGDDIGAVGGCGLFGTPMMTCNDFCSYGERRSDD